jgi:copper oxidase (laccase) domain-containing protein
VTEAALTAMATLGTRPSSVVAAIGPAIGPDRYQVGDDVADAVRAALGEHATLALRPDSTGRWLLDLWAANRIILTEAGVAGEHIHVAAISTGPPGPFFSHRAARPCGRFGLIARLRPREP